MTHFRFTDFLGAAALSLCLALGARTTALAETLGSAPEAAEIDKAASADGAPVSFADILLEYQTLNRRLETVSYRLSKANVELCPQTTRSIGVSVHLLDDYPKSIQPYASVLNQASNHLRVRTVWPGSAAERAGIIPNDEITWVGASAVPTGPSAHSFYEAATRREFVKPTADLGLVRGQQSMTAQAEPETICHYPAHIFYSDIINGVTDGQEIWITSGLIQAMPSDDNLALVTAHEMAHAIAGHTKLTPKAEYELEADKMALVMMARAGFNIEAAIAHWQKSPSAYAEQAHGHHPDMDKRQAEFQRTASKIAALKKRSQLPTFKNVN